ncbi:MAG: hypothetical protein ACK5ZT_11715 [Sphingobacteriaceae bacterium]|jgi:hypothetical protein
MNDNMLKEFIDTGVSLREIGITTNINERVKYTANTKTTYSTTNVPYQLIVGASNGTLVKTMTIKTVVNTVKGGLYIYLSPDGGSTLRLIDEVYIANKIKSGTTESFEVTYELDFYLASGWSLYSYFNTMQALVILMEGLDMSY